MKQRMLTPGPTPVPEETLLEMAKPVFYHRSPQARHLLMEVQEDLKYVFCTNNPVVDADLFRHRRHGGGRRQLRPAGRQGDLPERRPLGRALEATCARRSALEVVTVTAPYGQAVQPEQLAEALAKHPDAAAVAATLSETATGVRHDIEAFGKLVAPTPAVLIVDAISGLGVTPCRTDDWHVDVCVTGSQKALMLPPGLAFASVSDKAWRRIEQNPAPHAFYFDLKKVPRRRGDRRNAVHAGHYAGAGAAGQPEAAAGGGHRERLGAARAGGRRGAGGHCGAGPGAVRGAAGGWADGVQGPGGDRRRSRS